MTGDLDGRRDVEVREGEALATASVSVPMIGDRALDGESLGQLFAEHHRRVLRAAYRITGSMADAEDVAQAVFLRLAAGDGTAAKNAGSYLYRAAVNGALDLLRRRKTWGSESLDSDAGTNAVASLSQSSWGNSPERDLAARELGDQLRLAIGELAPRAAEMFVLRYVEDLGNREIAVLMGSSQAVVSVTLYQARTKLKARLRDLHGRRNETR